MISLLNLSNLVYKTFLLFLYLQIHYITISIKQNTNIKRQYLKLTIVS